MKAFACALVRHPRLFLLGNLLLTVGLGFYAARIRIESTVESVLPAGDPEVAYYSATRATFGSDDVAVVGILAEDLFAPATLEKIARVTNALSLIDGVERVLSITNAVDPAADLITPPRLLPRIPPTPAEVEVLRRKLESTPLYGKNLVADDFRGAAINVFFKNMTDAQYLDRGIDERIRQLLAAESGPERFFYTGAAHVKQAAVGMIRDDLRRFTPLALGAIVLVLLVAFLTLRGVLLPIVTVSMALCWTLGVMVLAGKSITLGTFVLPPLLLVVGSSYAIHVMARYYEQVHAQAPPDELVLRAFERVWQPLVISAIVTALGFGALAVNRITAIRDLGIFAVVGVLFLTLASLTAIPAALQLMGAELRTARSGKIFPWLSNVLTQLGSYAYHARTAILWGAGLLALLGLAGALLIRVDSDFLNYFEPDSEVRLANQTINREIVGSNPFFIVIEGTEAGQLQRWEVLKQIKDLQGFIAHLPGITSSLSIVDYLELLESGLQKGGEGDLVVDEQGNLRASEKPPSFWEDPKQLDTVLKAVKTSPSTFKGVVTKDFDQASILVRTNLSGSRRVQETLTKIRTYINERFPADLRVHMTGNLVLLTGTASDIVRGQIESLSIALGTIFVVMALMFLSVKVGFLAILPNVLPIILFFGVMGWCGIQLNLGTSLIAAISLGIAVDSTIHYMARLNRELQGEVDQEAAIVRALRTVGVPIIYTTVALFLGFLTLAGSSFVPIQSFGILAATTMVTALIANLVLLPAVLATTKIITLWDLVSVKLGEDPSRTIPLFTGLRPAQARIVVLMGEIKRFEPGEVIVHQGEEGNEMYVILQGATEVWAGTDGERRRVARHRRGDVFGEMGLVRHDQRTADVVAAEPVEVLAVNERFLERIQMRYPRIAARVFLNLTRILSDRLQRTTEQYVAARAHGAA